MIGRQSVLLTNKRMLTPHTSVQAETELAMKIYHEL